MIKVLVVGSIGAGKSTACKIFKEFGIPVFCSDKQSKKLMNHHMHVVDKIKAEFGEDLYIGNKLDRKALGDIVFKDKEKLKVLESIVHPAVSEYFDFWVEAKENAKKYKYVIEEAAIGIELGIQDKFDFVVLVTADEDVRIKRVMSRDNCSEEKVRERMNNQMSDEDKKAYADFVIINNDFPNLECQVKAIHEKILDSIKK